MPQHEPNRGFGSMLSNSIPKQIFGGSYRYFTGSLAYVLHRVTGLGLLVFLCFHILSITKAGMDPSKYDLLYFRFQEPDFKLGELGLYFALLFHGINGIRLLFVDFVLERTHVSKKLFWVCLVVIGALFILGAIPLIGHFNTQPLVTEGLPGGAH